MRIILPLFLIFSAVIAFFLFTGNGLVQMQKMVNRFASPVLSIGSVQGKLAGYWSAEHIVLELPDFSLVVDKVECSWNPFGLLAGRLALAQVTVDGSRLTLKGNGSSDEAAGAELPELFLPFWLVVEQLEIKNFQISEMGDTAFFSTEYMTTSVDWRGGLVNVKDFVFRGEGLELSLHGTVEPGPGWHIDILGGYVFEAEGYHRLAGTFSFKGPLDKLQFHLGMREPASIEAEGILAGLTGEMSCRMKVQGNGVDFSRFQHEWPKIILEQADVEISATVEGYHGEITATGGWDDLEHVLIRSSLDGGWEGITFRSLTLQQNGQKAHVEAAAISWRDIFDWRGKFIFERFDLGIIPGSITGTVDAEIESRGTVVENGVRANFAIHSLAGVVERQAVSLVGELFLTENRIYTNSLGVKSDKLAGELQVHHAELSWPEEKLSWRGEFSFENIDPSVLPDFHAFNGDLRGHIIADGTSEENDLSARITILDLGGTMMDQVVSGKGEIRYDNGRFMTDGLVLKQGDAVFEVEGTAGDDLELAFHLIVPDAGQVLPATEGSFSLQGNLTGSFQDPGLKAELHGENISWQEKKLAALEVAFSGYPFSGKGIRGSVQLEGIKVPEIDLDRVEARINGSFEKHEIQLHFAGKSGTFVLTGNGGLSGSDWEGTLYDGRLAGGSFSWNQGKAAVFSVGTTGFDLENFCLFDGTGRICLAGRMGKSESGLLWQLKASLEDGALSWLNRLQLFSLPVTGTVDGIFEARGDETGINDAHFFLDSSNMAFEVGRIDEDFQNMNLAQTRLSGKLKEGMASVDFSTSMANGSSLHILASLENLGGFQTVFQDIPLAGKIEIDNFNLGFVGAMSGFNVEPTGKLTGIFDLTGTVSQPEISGSMSLGKGSVILPYQGVTLNDVTVSLSGEKDGARLEFLAASGKGRLQGTGRVRYGNGPVSVDLHVKGDNFLLFSLPEYEIAISPDVYLFFSGEKGEIKGKVKIPHALITPEEMTSSVSVSEDVVLLNGREEVQEKRWPFYTTLAVYLGDDVIIDGYGLKGRLTGELQVEDKPASFLTGVGELDLVDGTFSIFGRSLDLVRGRVLFTGGPIDSPGIDVRAQKVVSAEKARGDGYVVGVDVSGLVQDLQFHLFSDPFMEDTEILSQLIVGHSLAGSSREEGSLLSAAAVSLGLKGGNTIISNLTDILSVDDLHLEGSGAREDVSLVMGKRLSKDLYLGYDINMFNQSGVFRVRYDLKHGFSIETRTSPEATGADLIYIFER
jgi:translocation and assembly module TamB